MVMMAREMEIREEGREEGRVEGREEGISIGETKGANMLGSLITLLISQGRTDDVARVAKDEAYRKELFREFQLA